MKLTKQFVEKLFKNLENGHQEEFFSQVSPNVLWEVMGTHTLAGVYHGKQEFRKRQISCILQKENNMI